MVTVKPTFEALVDFIISDCPEMIEPLRQAADKRLEIIARAVAQNPELPATAMEAVVESLLERLEEGTYTPD